MPSHNWDKTTENDRAETVITDEDNGNHAKVTSDGELYVTNAEGDDFVVISWPHYQIHKGNGFSVTGTVQLQANAFSRFLITTPSEKHMHLIYYFSSQGETHYFIYENPTVGTSGTMSVFNKNRASSTTSGAVLAPITTVTTSGTKIWTGITGSGNVIGSSLANERGEWVLDPASTYMIELNSKANGNTVYFNMEWYEHEL